MIKVILEKLAQYKDLSFEEAKQAFLLILEAKLSAAQIAALLMGLRMKGETKDEIRALAEIMRKKSLKLKVKDTVIDIEQDALLDDEIVLDTCGTGGKPVKTFNISTCVAFVVAGAGIKVAKHGNRSFSGVCGSADVLEALGVRLDVATHLVEQAIKRIGIGFLYAPLYHPAMKNVASVRKEMGIRTIFNIVGPLTNPAGATHQVLGVYDKNLTEKIAQVLRDLRIKAAYVVWGQDVHDEISITGKTKITEVKNKRIKTFYLTPRDFGLKRSKLYQIKGKSVSENVTSVLGVLKAEPSAKLDAVLINAAACFVLLGLAKDFKDATKLAEEVLQSGKALAKLKALKEFLNKGK